MICSQTCICKTVLFNWRRGVVKNYVYQSFHCWGRLTLSKEFISTSIWRRGVMKSSVCQRVLCQGKGGALKTSTTKFLFGKGNVVTTYTSQREFCVGRRVQCILTSAKELCAVTNSVLLSLSRVLLNVLSSSGVKIR